MNTFKPSVSTRLNWILSIQKQCFHAGEDSGFGKVGCGCRCGCTYHSQPPPFAPTPPEQASPQLLLLQDGTGEPPHLLWIHPCFLTSYSSAIKSMAGELVAAVNRILLLYIIIKHLKIREKTPNPYSVQTVRPGCPVSNVLYFIFSYEHYRESL